MVTASEIGLRIMEVTAILLPLLGIFMQVFIRSMNRSSSDWTVRQARFGYTFLSTTTIAVVIAGAAAILPFISETTPIAILIPLMALYVGYFGIGVTIVALAGMSWSAEESIQQVLLSAWKSNRE